MDSLAAKASEIFSSNVSEFQKLCGLYKSMLDKNFGERFCIGEHCRTVFMVEIRFDGSGWGTTPKVLYSEEEAEKEIEAIKLKYSFISEYRIITRKIEEKEKNP